MPSPKSAQRDLVRALEAASQGVCLVDDRLRVVYVNPAGTELLGLSSDALLGQECRYHSEALDDPAAGAACAPWPPPSIWADPLAENSPVLIRFAERTLAARFVPLGGEGETRAVLVLFGSALDDASTRAPDDLHAALAAFRRTERTDSLPEPWLGHSPAARRVREQLVVAGGCDAHVVLVGPAGCGRQQVARAIHRARHGSGGVALLPLGCGVLEEDVLRSTLGAMARATAAGDRRGTLLLNDLDAMPASVQAELWGVLQKGTLPFRVIATSRLPLGTLARGETFRADLAELLSTLVIEMPPLAERRIDLPLLAQALVEHCNRQSKKQLAGITPEAMELLLLAPWPGDVEELVRALERAHQAAEGPWIGVGDLPVSFRHRLDAGPPPRSREPIRDLPTLLDAFEREVLRRAMAQARGNKTLAAGQLKLSRARLHRRLVQLGLETSLESALEQLAQAEAEQLRVDEEPRP